jgi:hypothetical protein
MVTSVAISEFQRPGGRRPSRSLIEINKGFREIADEMNDYPKRLCLGLTGSSVSNPLQDSLSPHAPHLLGGAHLTDVRNAFVCSDCWSQF